MTDVLSYPPGTVSRVPFHPWRAIWRLPNVRIVWQREDGVLGSWCERTRTLTFNPDQNQAERRCTATHELVHAERGDVACDPSVHREAARRLIDIHDLGEAMVFYETDASQIAEELWVDLITLRTRLDHLHPAERGYLKRRLEMKEHCA